MASRIIIWSKLKPAINFTNQLILRNIPAGSSLINGFTISIIDGQQNAINSRRLWTSNVVQMKFIDKKPRKKKSEEDDDVDTDDETEEIAKLKDIVDDGTPRDFSVTDYQFESTRLDKLSRKFFGLSGSQCEDLLMSGKLRLNGEKIKVKAKQLITSDTLDLFIENNAENSKFTHVSRVEIYSIAYNMKTNMYKMRVKKWKNLLIPDWVKD